MRRSWSISALSLLLIVALSGLLSSAPVSASSHPGSRAAKKSCKTITKTVRGKKKKVKVCKTVKPTASPTPVLDPSKTGPIDVAVDNEGYLYVQRLGIVTKYTPDGTPVANSPSNLFKAGPDCAPWGLALSPQGTIYVADECQPTTITVLSPSLQHIHTYTGDAGHQYNYLAMDRQGNIDAPSASGSLDQFSADGSHHTILHQFASDDDIWGVAIEGDGSILVSIVSKATIVRLSPTGMELTRASLPPQYREVDALAVDSHGFVYAAAGPGCQCKDEVIKLSPTFQEVGVVAPQGTGPGQVNTPLGMRVDAQDNLYVADFGNHRIDKFSPSGALLATVPVATP